MEEENKQEQTVEEEVAEEVKTTEEKEDTEEGYIDLTKEETKEEEKFQEVVNAAEKIDEPNIDEVVEHKETAETTSEEDNDGEEVPEIDPKNEEETDTIIPEETANVIKDQELIFVQYVCENPNCMLKFYINKVDDALGDKLKCYGCGKKLAKKKRLMDVTLKQYKAYTE